MVEIDRVLGQVRARSTPQTRVVIGVPNAASTLYRLIGERYPYYDIEEHPQQFTGDSLDRALARSGFVLDRRLFALQYSSSPICKGCSVDEPPLVHPLYQRAAAETAQSAAKVGRAVRDLRHGVIASVLAPAALVMSLHDQLRPAKGAVLTACYRSAP